MKALLEAMTPNLADWALAMAIDPRRLPVHVAVIMDGNGRWAGKRFLPRVAGHKAGISPVRETVETCARLGLQALTLYAFSIENWKRPAAEVDTLWHLLRLYLRNELRTLQENNVRLGAIGRIDDLPPVVRKELDATMRDTENNTGLRLNLAINYGGRVEILDAVNQLLAEARANGTLDTLRVDEESLSARLYTGGLPDPDLLIRTSGELRVSNFLLWQIAYTEIYVTETLWPDFRRADLLQAILAYQKRERRFGGLSNSATPEVLAETVSSR
jgi:undecaprenyl diphosphate synthase